MQLTENLLLEDTIFSERDQFQNRPILTSVSKIALTNRLKTVSIFVPQNRLFFFRLYMDKNEKYK